MIREGDVIVFDSEVKQAGKYMRAYCEELQNKLNQYIRIVEGLSNEGVQDELIRMNLQSLAAAGKSLVPSLEYCAGSIDSGASSFISEVDAADEFLY